jgi:hypothetical protein
MAQSAHSQERRANPLEILGAWLHIWVPPRDAYVPPIPWKKIGIACAAVLAITGIALAIMVPRIDDHKEQTAAANAEYKRKAVEKNRVRINKLQQARHGEAKSLLPPAGALAADRAVAKQELLAHVQDDMFADAKARAARGEMKMVSVPPKCEHTAGTPTSGEIGVFDCFMITSKIPMGKNNPSGALGYPFRAVLHYDTFTYDYCKTELIPGEMLVLAPKDVTLLPKECQGPKA